MTRAPVLHLLCMQALYAKGYVDSYIRHSLCCRVCQTPHVLWPMLPDIWAVRRHWQPSKASAVCCLLGSAQLQGKQCICLCPVACCHTCQLTPYQAKAVLLLWQMCKLTHQICIEHYIYLCTITNTCAQVTAQGCCPHCLLLAAPA